MSSSLPLVSIVIPAHNRAAYLATAIDSVFSQDYPHIELIVLDDGSTDGTRSVLAKYGGRLRWESQANIGQAATLNKGWAMAQGEILGYLGDDDFYLPGLVSRSVGVLHRTGQVVLTYCDYQLVSADSTVLRTVRAPEFSYEQMLTEFVVAPGPGSFFRRAAFDRIGGWDPSLRQVPDYEYWLRLGLVGSFHRIPEVLAAFRVHEGSLSFSKADVERANEPVRVVERFFDSPQVPADIARLRDRALSRAHVVAARAHLRAGRWRAAMKSLRDGWRINARGVATWWGLRLIFSGVFNRPAHFLLRHLARLRRRSSG